jgi:hypothetical protein
MTGALNWATTQTIASATTTNIGAATSNSVIVSGTTTITGLGTIAAGAERVVQFSGALTLTHNATSLILPGGASITTAAGDVAYFVSLGTGNWRCTGYQKANGQAVVASGGTGDFKSDGTVAMTAKIRCPITGTVSAFIGSSGTTSSDVAIWSDLSKFYFLNGNNTGYVPVNTGPLTASGLVTSSGGFIHGSTGGLASNINGGWALLNSVLTAYVNATAAKLFVTGATTTYDTAWERGASGRMDATNGSGNLRDVRGRSLISSGGTITLSNYTVATLPTAASNAHAIVAVTDGNASPTYRGAVTGGGSTNGVVYCDGSSWMWH